ncbi:MAG: phosphoribosyl-AMP cyclohydrolase [Acetobacter fabarum]|jgi:phosphoribosyl-AMP cyclohydrolase|uniref:Phosphoribosyl-AMP cyclohydrolase n=1 Tax=Acetobacter fabarum TaxID=483199 RepID=A0A269XZS1_9PROT|nr:MULTISPECIES: phosphoribosyl-AMP cyclohydrolase [Acetobacter]MCH4026243.1 phosphoribosyl-AMP cyclohydrolase [Acetobacter fabarum]MCH4055240.1 phosphoribosyl-AMP cyclohydrolase [Acetobacter fabarum]MCH4085895.1 phosphoribosyl-AMP cyclohydrolase [Acetobacter fabarum]MCH4127513.1 phosphoribosyl-AMP cyclohydrolase [Acetobacter fabarum]MCH4136862.1 phosphoribosyl-AMP cyclohydrolase [Acetobacter fabarum]
MTYTAPDAAVLDAMLSTVKYDASGLIAAIAQQHDTGEVLMIAWMNAEALRETLLSGRVCYYSRSRKKLWRKGETSGQVQHLHEARLDCDADAVLLLVNQIGVACHTGRRSCFYRAFSPTGLLELTKPEIDPAELYKTHGHTHA